jgi:hypothetical protein
MTVSNSETNGWIFRIVNKRSVIVKAKNEKIRKISAQDLTTKLSFPLEAPKDFQLDSLTVEKGYFITIKIYTSRNTANVGSDFVEFFEVLDVDQSAEDFIKAYWLYPDKIRFELVEAEPL